jgi:hypothetical protein
MKTGYQGSCAAQIHGIAQEAGMPLAPPGHLALKDPQSELVENVSQSFGRPESMPRLNQRTRCSDEP